MNWLRQKIVHRVVLALFLLGMSAIPIPVFADDQDFFDYARERANQGNEGGIGGRHGTR